MSKKKRSLKALGASVVAVLAMSIGASAAQASHGWSVEGAMVGGAGSPQTVGCTLLSSSLSISTEIGSTKVTFKAKGFDCIGESRVWKDAMRGETELEEGEDDGVLLFTGVTVEGGPVGCLVKGGQIEFKPLKTELRTTPMFTSGLGDKFTPTEGTTFTTFTLEKCGALNGSFPLKGSFWGETEELGRELVEQPLRFNATTAEDSTLAFGTKKVTLSGEVGVVLTGANAGRKWGATK